MRQLTHELYKTGPAKGNYWLVKTFFQSILILIGFLNLKDKSSVLDNIAINNIFIHAKVSLLIIYLYSNSFIIHVLAAKKKLKTIVVSASEIFIIHVLAAKKLKTIVVSGEIYIWEFDIRIHF